MAGKRQNWVVQHQMDDEPTYVLDKANDPNGDNAIEFPASLPWEYRLAMGAMLAAYLNHKAATLACTPGAALVKACEKLVERYGPASGYTGEQEKELREAEIAIQRGKVAFFS